MQYTTNREMAKALENREEIKGNSVTAYWDNDEYIVISYETVMLKFQNGEVTFYNDTYYSRTTSKLQNLLKGAFNIK